MFDFHDIIFFSFVRPKEKKQKKKAPRKPIKENPCVIYKRHAVNAAQGFL